MNQMMSKGLLIYTAVLFFTAIASFVITVPQYSIFAGMAVLAALTLVLAVSIGRDMQTMATSSVRERDCNI